MGDEEKHKRKFTRINYDTPVILTQGDKEWQTLVIDLSLKGLLVWLPDDWDANPDELITATMPLGGDAIISMTIRQVHASNDRAGFICETIHEDSVQHIRRLLEMNLGDPNLVERELSALGQ